MKTIKLSSSWLGEGEIQNVKRVMMSQSINMGMETKRFEEALCDFFGGQKHVSCTGSCTAALHLALQCNDIKKGDEVLVPTYTFIATFQAIKATGATPVPCDVDLDDGFLNIDDATARCNSKTKAILPVLFAGCSAKIDRVYEFAKSRSIKVIEDAAHCFGDENISKRDGTLCFSFDPIKNITCISGGAVLTSDQELAQRINDARLLGVMGDTEARYRGERSFDAQTEAQGWRYHMNDVEAAVGLAQLEKFEQIKNLRQKYANMYIKALGSLESIKLFPINTKTAVPHIFPIIIANKKRDALRKHLLQHGISTGIQYKPNHLLEYFQMGYDLPNSVWLFENIISLPLHPLLSDDDVEYIIDKIKNW